MSLYDFYMYLTHIEYSAENLEFYIWWVLSSHYLGRLANNGQVQEL
jgi:hypothetical protein